MADRPSKPVWRFTPVAAFDDPHWQGRRIWRAFDVIAATSGEAIAAASREEQELLGYDPIRDSQDFQERRSGFADPALYRLDRLPEDAPQTLVRVLAEPAQAPST